MSTAITKIMNKAKPKLKALLRTQPYYTTTELFTQYKTHILPLLESCSGAIYHSTTTALAPITALFTTFLRATNTTPLDAFTQHNLAPPTLRRDIAMLGLLHKTTLRKAHSDFTTLFPPSTYTHRHDTRLAQRRHDKQLHELCDGTQTEQLNRSIFALTRIYNLLPQAIINATTIHRFQTLLTRTARNFAHEHPDTFDTFFSPRQPTTPNYDDYFTNDDNDSHARPNRPPRHKQRRRNETLRRQARAETLRQALPLALA